MFDQFANDINSPSLFNILCHNAAYPQGSEFNYSSSMDGGSHDGFPQMMASMTPRQGTPSQRGVRVRVCLFVCVCVRVYVMCVRVLCA